MQVSSINFCSKNKVNSYQYKAISTHKRRNIEEDYVHIKNENDKKYAQKNAIRALAAVSASLITLCSVIGLGAKANDEGIEKPEIINPNPIIEEGEIPSQTILNDNEHTVIIEAQEEETINMVEDEDIEDTEEINPAIDFKITLTEEQERALEQFRANWEENSDRYFNMQFETNVPAELIAAIHWRESSGDFNTYLHNGAKLGQPIDTYLGERIYYNWEDAAKDALLNYAQPEKIDIANIETYYDFAERYNGLGYRKAGLNSPYVWAGTDNYTSGKYVADGKYDSSVVDEQVGVAVLLNELINNY